VGEGRVVATSLLWTPEGFVVLWAEDSGPLPTRRLGLTLMTETGARRGEDLLLAQAPAEQLRLGAHALTQSGGQLAATWEESEWTPEGGLRVWGVLQRLDLQGQLLGEQVRVPTDSSAVGTRALPVAEGFLLVTPGAEVGLTQVSGDGSVVHPPGPPPAGPTESLQALTAQEESLLLLWRETGHGTWSLHRRTPGGQWEEKATELELPAEAEVVDVVPGADGLLRVLLSIATQEDPRSRSLMRAVLDEGGQVLGGVQQVAASTAWQRITGRLVLGGEQETMVWLSRRWGEQVGGYNTIPMLARRVGEHPGAECGLAPRALLADASHEAIDAVWSPRAQQFAVVWQDTRLVEGPAGEEASAAPCLLFRTLLPHECSP
jgi:hypothetical protein